MRGARDELIGRILDDLLVMGGDADRLTAAAAGFNRLNRTDLRALRVLRSHGMTAGALARALDVTSGATTRVIDSMAAAGYVRREADPRDRRRVLVSVTPAAVQIVDRTFARLGADTRTVLEGYGEEELETIVRFLADVGTLVRAHTRRLEQPADG
jgi:DNA-binding MarR family transcriptional regulator